MTSDKNIYDFVTAPALPGRRSCQVSKEGVVATTQFIEMLFNTEIVTTISTERLNNIKTDL